MSESNDANAAPEWLASKAPPTNPVSRLLAVLERMVTPTAPDDVKKVWLQTFWLDEDDDPYQVIAQTLVLVAEARAAVEPQTSEENERLYLDPFDHLSGIISSMVLNKTAVPFIDGIRAGMMSLRFCSEMVDTADERRRVDTDLVAELWAAVNSLLESVLASELPEPVRGILCERIRAVRQAIEEFQLVGLDGLEESLDGMAGALMRGSQDVKRGSKVREGFRAVIELGQKILVSAGKAKELAEPLVKLLGSGEG